MFTLDTLIWGVWKGRSWAVIGGKAATTLLALMVVFPAKHALAQYSYASKERAHAAKAHYARARAMIVEALEEFEQGRRYAQPDLLIDSEEFRLSLISLGEQLNRVIDPKPRVTRAGVVFQASPRMIRRERDRLPTVPDGIQESNVYGERQRARELESARASVYSEETAEPVAESPETATEGGEPEEAPEETAETASNTNEGASEDQVSEQEEVVSENEQSQEPDRGAVTGEEVGKPAPANNSENNSDVVEEETASLTQDKQHVTSVEQAIKERLRKLQTRTETEQADDETSQQGEQAVEEEEEE